MKLNGDDDYRAFTFSVIYLYDLFQFKCKLLFIHIWLGVVKKFLETQPDIYTVGHKKRATFIFTITLANVDRFQ